MMFPERFSNLPAHVWPRLRALLDAHEGGGPAVHMTIGEPKHAFPEWVVDEITRNAAGFNSYPPNEGSPELRQAATGWIARRYGVELDADTEVMALNGTREGLYNVVMALCPETKGGGRPAVLMPNPLYPVYMIAAISGDAEPVLVSATAENGHLPDYASVGGMFCGVPLRSTSAPLRIRRARWRRAPIGTRCSIWRKGTISAFSPMNATRRSIATSHRWGRCRSRRSGVWTSTGWRYFIR